MIKLCTPTDRALAIEELEELEHKVRSWKMCLEHMKKCNTCQRKLPEVLAREMEKSLKELKKE